MFVTRILSGSLGKTIGAASSTRPVTRLSVVLRVQVSPASSERKIPELLEAPMVAYRRCGLLGAIASSAWLNPSGIPFIIGFQVVPPSVDLKIPPFEPP